MDIIRTLATLMLAASATLAGQTVDRNPSAAGQAIELRTGSRIVLVPTTARTKTGQFLPGLQAKDFTLTDNGHAQMIDLEETHGEPVAVVVVLQTGANANRSFSNYRTMSRLLEFASTATLRKVAFVTFDSKPRQIWNFPDRREGIQYALDHPATGDPQAAILDATRVAIELLQQQPASLRKMILLLTQMQDVGSSTSYLEILQQLGQSDITVYSATFPQPGARGKACRSPAESFNSTGLHEQLVSLCRSTAGELAAISGGEQITIANRNDLERGVAILRGAFLHSYLLRFKPNPVSSGRHALAVRPSTASRSIISARRFYWLP